MKLFKQSRDNSKVFTPNIKDVRKLEKNVKELRRDLGTFSRYMAVWSYNIIQMPYWACVERPQRYRPIKVSISDEFIKKNGDKYIKGVILHEVLHVYNNHFTRQENIKDITISLKELGIYPSLWNVSTDLAINYMIKNYFNDINVDLPKGVLLPDLFPHEIKEQIEDQTSERIFEILKEKYKEDTEKFEKMMSEIAKKMQQNGQPMPNHNQQQNGGQGQQGQPMPSRGSGQGKKNKGKDNKDGQGQGQGNGKYNPNAPHIGMGFDDHNKGNKVQLNPKEAKEIESQMKGSDAGKDVSDSKDTKEIGQNWNHSPEGDPLDYAISKMAIDQYKSVKIGRILKAIRAKMVKNASSLIPTKEYSFQKPPRRKHTIYKRFGAVYQGKRIIRKSKDLVVALDTSGSVSDEDIRMAVKVINGFMADWKFNIYLIQCDRSIHEVSYHSKKIRKFDALGRGGTNYQPVFDYVKKKFIDKGDDPRNLMIVYIGDGQTSSGIESYGINTIWLLNRCWDRNFYDTVPFGEKYILPDVIIGE